MEQRLTEDDQLTLKTGAFGAVFLVSNADPGMLALLRESFAASEPMGQASDPVRESLTTGPLPKLPRGSTAEVESVVLSALGQAMEILRAKSPQDVAGYRSLVLAAADRAAQAHRGVVPVEVAAIEKVRAALAEPA